MAGHTAMDQARAVGYAVMNVVLLHRYEITKKMYCQWLRPAQQKDGGMQTELVNCLLNLVNKWVRHCSTVDKLLDAIVLEQLLNTLEPALHMWVKNWKLTTSTGTGRLADDYKWARTQKTPGPRQCYSW